MAITNHQVIRNKAPAVSAKDNLLNNKPFPPLTNTTTDKDYQIRLLQLKRGIIPYRYSSPSKNIDERKRRKSSGAKLDSFYILIESVLRNIRNKKHKSADYVFCEDQVIEILRYEPRAKITYLQDYIWKVSL